jgi:hypothetical protein
MFVDGAVVDVGDTGVDHGDHFVVVVLSGVNEIRVGAEG